MQYFKNLYFIGIGGIGMSATAGIAKSFGYIVLGSDASTIYQPSKGVLEKYQIPHFIGYNKDNFINANLEKEKEGENLLGALLGGYGSEKEEREEEKEEENGKGREKLAVVTAIIAHLIKATTSSSSSAPTTIQSISLAQIIQQRLSTDPVIASFIHPEAPFHNVFKDAIESAVAAGAMDENIAGVWLGNSIKSKLSVPDSDAAMKGNGATEVAGKKEIKEKKEEPVSIRVAENEKKIKKEKNTSKSRSIPELDANKLEKRKEKVRLLLERQRQVAEERRQGQAAAAAAAEKERTKHLAAISVHKRMFLDNSDDE